MQSLARRSQSPSTYESWAVNEGLGFEPGDEPLDIDMRSRAARAQTSVLQRGCRADGSDNELGRHNLDGRGIPHRRHWRALLQLVNEQVAQRELNDRSMKEVFK